jgi:hypothetical protein
MALTERRRLGGFSWRYLNEPASHAPQAKPTPQGFRKFNQEKQNAGQCPNHSPTAKFHGSGLERRRHERLRISRPIQ